jgi:hypothetical protein
MDEWIGDTYLRISAAFLMRELIPELMPELMF